MERWTPDQFEMFDRPTSPGSINATSSPVSVCGLSPSDGPTGPTIARSGPVHVPANLSAKQAREQGLMTSGTFGPTGSGSSTSIALTQSLANRLRARTEGCGSTLYALTWKRAITPAGRLYFLLRGSVRRTSDTGCSGWPTPDAHPDAPNTSMNRGSKHGGERRRITPAGLGLVAQTAGWPTPKATDATSNNESRESRLARGSSGSVNLPTAACLAGERQKDGQPLLVGWATPATRDYRTPNHVAWKNRGGGAKGEQLNNQVAHVIPGASLNGLTAPTESAGLLNPEFSRWLQGIPATWPSCAPTATRSTRSSRPK